MNPSNRGRARDQRIDDDVLAAAARQLSVYGYEAMSVSAVAHEAHTTRQAVYRRWPHKSALAAAAITATADTGVGLPSSSDRRGDVFDALVAELEDFRRSVCRPGRLSLVGTMLQDSTDADAQRRYRQRIVAPRRQRFRSILQQAVEEGSVDADADLEVAVTMLSGSWYANALAGTRPLSGWALRTATLVWRAVGGTVL